MELKEFPSLMLKKPASKIVKLEEKENQWQETVMPVEEWGKIVTKSDIEVGFRSSLADPLFLKFTKLTEFSWRTIS